MIGILSIGTEITTGQILNKNAQWLSMELLKLGLSAPVQITVPDDANLIRDSLKFLEDHVKVILVTGGLGPTADDFTRNVLAETYKRPLQWNEENWQKVQAKLNSRNVQIRPLHRQQCFFPEGAEIFANTVGIADGFSLKLGPLEVIALPGPPKELANLWENHLRDRLAHLAPVELRWTQLIWTTQGLPESEVATKVNAALESNEAELVLYRVHSPHVDVKLLFQNKDSEYYHHLGQKIQQALKPWLTQPTEAQ